MSALLEALKKAAEEKKIKQGMSLSTTQTKTCVESKTKSTEDISLNLIGDLDNINSSDDKVLKNHNDFSFSLTIPPETSETSETSAEGVYGAIPFQLESISAEMNQEGSLPNKLDSDSNLAADNSPIEFFSSEPNMMDSQAVNNDTILKESKDPLLNYMTPKLDGRESEATEKDEDLMVSNLEDFSTETSSLSKLSPQESLFNKTQAFDFLPEKEEFDWSLANIPAYQQQAENEQQLNSNRVLKGLSVNQNKQNSKRSQWVLLALLLLLFLTGLGFYLLDYYDSSQINANQSLKRFELPSKPLISEDNSISQKVNESTHVKSSEPVITASAEGLKASEMPSKIEIKILKENKQKISKPIISKPLMHTSDNRKEVNQPKAISTRPPTKNLVITSSTELSKEQQAYQAYLQGDFVEAKGLYQQSLKLNPRSVSALVGLGAIAVKDGETQKAHDYYEMASRIDPNNLKIQSALISLRSFTGSYENWIDSLKNLIARQPSDANLYFALGNLYVKRKDWVNAQTNFFKALELSPNQAQYALNLAISLDHLGQYLLAEKHYQTALALSSVSQPLKTEAQVKARILAIQNFLAEVSRGD